MWFVAGWIVGIILYHFYRSRRKPDQACYAACVDISPVRDSPSRTIRTKVVGVTYDGRQEVIKTFCRDDSEIELVREPENPYDKNAIGVWLAWPRRQIGYLSRDLARQLRDKNDLRARVLWVTGHEFPYRGVNIEVSC